MTFSPSSSALAAAKTMIANERTSMKKTILNEVDDIVELVKEDIIEDAEILDPELVEAEKIKEEESDAIKSSDKIIENENNGKMSKKSKRKEKAARTSKTSNERLVEICKNIFQAEPIIDNHGEHSTKRSNSWRFKKIEDIDLVTEEFNCKLKIVKDKLCLIQR